MTELAPTLAAIMVIVPLLGALAVTLARTARQAELLAFATAVSAALTALIVGCVGLTHDGPAAVRGHWYLIDRAGGVLLAVTAVVGLASVLVSPAQLRLSGRTWLSAASSHRLYYAALLIFWAALLAVQVAGNLALAWLLIEATTAASALLVSVSGKREALEAGWKYLVLTTLGLSVALLGIVILAVGQAQLGHHGLGALGWHALGAAAQQLRHGPATIAFVLLLAGLATKIGWAPVHNWLPDAHSEAPAPVSALLSAALLPTVVLVAWRVKVALIGSVGHATAATVFIGFGLASLAIAVPFLWQRLPWKRLLAYSSLEHMGVIALGIGFGTPLAMTGVAIHVAGHAIAKSLGFYAAIPLLRSDPAAAERPPSAVWSRAPGTAALMAASLVTLAGLPPSPLFVSELLILLGGVSAGYPAVSAVAVLALAGGFLGLVHALIEGLLGEGPGDRELIAGTDEGRIDRAVGEDRPAAAPTPIGGVT